MVDAIYFREANPNYARASIDESDKESSSLSGWTILGSDESEKSPVLEILLGNSLLIRNWYLYDLREPLELNTLIH